MTHPLFKITLVFITGIIFACVVPVSFSAIFFLTLTCLLGNISLFRYEKTSHFLLGLFIFLLGVLVLTNASSLASCHIAHQGYVIQNKTVGIKGEVSSFPVERRRTVSFFLRTKAIRCNKVLYRCCGTILVIVKNASQLRYGEELVINGILSRPFYNRGKKGQQYKNYLERQGIYYVMRAANTNVYVQSNQRSSFLCYFVDRLKSRMEGVVFRHLSWFSARIVNAMVLGEKKEIPRWFYNGMIKTGTVHILVVSGFNVGIVTYALLLVLKVLRISRRYRFLLAIPALILYCFVSGVANPVVRATIMAIIYIFAFWLKREVDLYNALAIAALCILIHRPLQLFDVSFQLSFISVISIVFLYSRIKILLRVDKLKILPLRIIIESLCVTLAAWIGTSGLVAYYFKLFTPISVLANLCIAPLAVLITLSGFCLILLGLFCPCIATIIAPCCEALTVVLAKVNATLVNLPYAYFHLAL